MSGDNTRDDDEFADDFVLEDVASDLENLFDDPPPKAPLAQPPAGRGVEAGAAASPEAAAGAKTPPGSGEEDLLFRDHTEGLRPTQEFTARQEFAEYSGAQWRGNHLRPDEIGIPVDAEAEAGSVGAPEQGMAPAQDRLLGDGGEDDFTLDGDQELQLVDDDSQLQGDGASTFILDEGDGAWSEANGAPAAGEAEAPADDGDGEFLPEGELVEAAATEEFAVDAEPLTPAASAGDEEHAPLADEVPAEPAAAELADAATGLAAAAALVDGATADTDWAPLAAEGADGTVDAAVPAAEATAGEDAEAGELVGAAVAVPTEVSEVVIDATAAAGAGVIGGVAPRRGRRLRLLAPLAAALLVLGGGVAVVLRPEWFGLRVEPELVERVHVARPAVEIALPPPAQPKAAAVATPEPTPKPVPAKDPEPNASPNPGSTPSTGSAPTPGNDPGKPPSATSTPEPVPAPVPTPTATAPAGSENPVAAQPPAPVPAPAVPGRDPQVAVAVPPDQPANPNANPGAAPAPGGAVQVPAERAIPVGEDLVVGALGKARKPEIVGEAIPGVTLGSKAFAQLRNGNFFIGSVKAIGSASLTMRMETGEVTLPMGEIAKLAALDSEEYKALQSATSGFIRLSNKNRLVGTILQGLADDQVVLQMKSNRLILPRSSIGQIEQGANEDNLQLKTGKEEEKWLRDMAGRILRDPDPRATSPGEERKATPIGKKPDPNRKEPTKPSVRVDTSKPEGGDK